MSQSGIAYMKSQMEAYFTKVKNAITTGGGASFRFRTGTVPASSTITFDAPTELGYTPVTHEIYSLGIQLAMVDPTISTDPPVVDALSVLRYEIQADGKVVIRNNHTGPVTYYARFTMPVKK